MNCLKPKHIVLLGASTGGPGLIEQIITSLQAPLNGCIVIAQHMQKSFLESFAKRLERINSIDVSLCDSKTPICSGKIYILQDTSHFEIENGTIYIKKDTSQESFYHPCIDTLFKSALCIKDVNTSVYILSGIGADGAEGMLLLKNSGAKTVAQDEKTSIVYGMPKAALEIKATSHIMSIDEIEKNIYTELQ